MEDFEVNLSQEVRLYRHLYDPSMKAHRDSQMCQTAWRDIAVNVGKDEATCRKIWKNLRDRFAKSRKRSGSGATGRQRPAPILEELSWLCEFVKNKPTETSIQTCAPQPGGSGSAMPQSDSEAWTAETPESARSSSPCRSSSLTLATPLPPVATHAAPNAAAASPSSLSVSTPRRRKRRAAPDNSVVEEHLANLREHRDKMWTEYKDNRDTCLLLAASPATGFFKVLADMMESVDPRVHDQLKQKLLQTMLEHAQQHPR
ncbi:unnamed protein product [Merluccius merluccius]